MRRQSEVNDEELKRKVKKSREGEKERKKRTKIIPTSFCLDRSRYSFIKIISPLRHERDRQWSFSLYTAKVDET